MTRFQALCMAGLFASRIALESIAYIAGRQPLMTATHPLLRIHQPLATYLLPLSTLPHCHTATQPHCHTAIDHESHAPSPTGGQHSLPAPAWSRVLTTSSGVTSTDDTTAETEPCTHCHYPHSHYPPSTLHHTATQPHSHTATLPHSH
jgi:hypothetical protein